MRPWKPGDESAFVLRADFARDRAATAWDWSQGEPGPTFTLLSDAGEVVGIGGVVAEGEGVWRAWAQMAETIRPRHMPQLLYWARRVLHSLECNRQVRSIEVYGQNNPRAYAFLRRLGFVLFDAIEWPGVGFVLCLRRGA